MQEAVFTHILFLDENGASAFQGLNVIMCSFEHLGLTPIKVKQAR